MPVAACFSGPGSSPECYILVPLGCSCCFFRFFVLLAPFWSSVAYPLLTSGSLMLAAADNPREPLVSVSWILARNPVYACDATLCSFNAKRNGALASAGHIFAARVKDLWRRTPPGQLR